MPFESVTWPFCQHFSRTFWNHVTYFSKSSLVSEATGAQLGEFPSCSFAVFTSSCPRASCCIYQSLNPAPWLTTENKQNQQPTQEGLGLHEEHLYSIALFSAWANVTKCTPDWPLVSGVGWLSVNGSVDLWYTGWSVHFLSKSSAKNSFKMLQLGLWFNVLYIWRTVELCSDRVLILYWFQATSLQHTLEAYTARYHTARMELHTPPCWTAVAEKNFYSTAHRNI